MSRVYQFIATLDQKKNIFFTRIVVIEEYFRRVIDLESYLTEILSEDKEKLRDTCFT